MTATLSRAGFVRTASATAGALVLGVAGDVCRNQSEASAASDDFTPNAWLSVHRDGTVTVRISKSEMGQGIATGTATVIADELEVPMGIVRIEFPPASADYNDPAFGMQLTGGSQSTISLFQPLRKAGATARAMLVAAAAQAWSVDPASCVTRSATVLHPSTNRRATYASLVGAAAAQPVPSDVTLKKPQQFIHIGKRFPRLDLRGKVTGTVQYGLDVRVPGMKYASVEQSPTLGGSVGSYDASAAKKVRGVIDVLQIASGVAVVAENTWAAFEGRKALRIAWNPGPHVHLNSADLYTHREALAKSRTGAKVAIERGDVTKAKGRVLEAVYRTPYLAHAPMEPMNATASVTEAGVEVWAPTQGQTIGRATAAEIAGVPLEKVVLHTTYLGGGFGRRSTAEYIAQAVAISKAMQAPIKVVWSREDDTQHGRFRPLSVNVLRGVLDNHGNLLALDHTAVAESVLDSMFGPAVLKNGIDPAQVAGINDAVFEIPNYRGSYVHMVDGVPTTTMRGPGASSNSFAVESFLDELAHAAGRDPLAFRLALYKNDHRATNVLKTVAQRADWSHPRTPGAKHGIAFAYWNGTAAAIVAEVTMRGNVPQVHRVTAVADAGLVINPDIVLAQLEGGVNYALSMALVGNITIKAGRIEQGNFNTYDVLQMSQAPQIDAHVVPSTERPTGIGEVSVPPLAPAVGNAVFALTGRRVRALPFV